MADLATKLGIKPGYKVALLDAPAELRAALEQACPAAEFYDSLGETPYELILFWPSQLAGLADTFAQHQRQIVPDGAIWAVIPRQRIARQRGITFSWEEMQAAGLQTDLVDNKIASISDEEYATRFVIRKDRRGKYGSASRHMP
ncbi:MAG TPA: hypothetical protein VH590_16125 [Ktedonobacterales bacterium]|jgi:hypothetical protein